MKIKHFAIVAGTVAGLSVAAPGGVLAAGMAEGDVASFESLDTDGDGLISAEEAQKHEGLYNAWQDVDVDANNQVDRSEFSAFEAGIAPPAEESGMEAQPEGSMGTE